MMLTIHETFTKFGRKNTERISRYPGKWTKYTGHFKITFPMSIRDLNNDMKISAEWKSVLKAGYYHRNQVRPLPIPPVHPYPVFF